MINNLENIKIGRFSPGSSLIHRMETRLKFILFISLIITISISPLNHLFFWAIFLPPAIRVLSKIPVTLLFKGLRPFLFLFLLTFFFHLFFTPGKPVPLFFLNSTGITYEGLQQGTTINIRLILLIYLSSVLTITTSPQKMAVSIEWLLSPLKLLGFPVRNFSMMILISLKFIPIIFQEIKKVAFYPKKSYSENLNMRQKIIEVVSLISPVVINSFRKANKLVQDIEAKGFDVIEKF